MPNSRRTNLSKFLKPFPEHVREIFLSLRDFVSELYPDANELIYDNYNAFVIGYSLSETAGDAFCALAVYSNYVNFGFNRGADLDDPKKMLKGSGSQYRHISVKSLEEFPAAYIKKLLKQAYRNAVTQLDKASTAKGKTITKSVSEKKRRPSKSASK